MTQDTPAALNPEHFLPLGAIVNGTTCIERLERDYAFRCEAGPLVNCADWDMLKRCFFHLAEHAQEIAQREPDGVTGWKGTQAATSAAGGATPIDMVLHCPACGLQHVDSPEPCKDCGDTGIAVGGLDSCPACIGISWANPPHRSHLCHGCGHIWRPADVPTNGVQAVKTVGKADSPVRAALAAQPPAASLTPLTDEQCIEAARKFFSGGAPGSSPELWFLRGLRAGEQAHGITTHKDAP